MGRESGPSDAFCALGMLKEPSMSKTTLQTIPLNKLVVSTVNVRKTDRKADIPALAASITSHGLLQNLSVVPADDGKFTVIAGGRRLAALKMLAKGGAIAKDYPVPCSVIAEINATEASLAENIHRVAMNPLDECEAFDTLQKQGHDPVGIARRFGVTVKHVEQRLALANLSPRLKAAWKRKDLSLDAARAFCLVTDHVRQEAVFKSMGKPVTHAGSVRARLMEGQMRASDRLVRFVTLESYEASGGGVRRDLFDPESVFIENPALVAELAVAKIAAAIPDWEGKGWGWIETTLENGRPEGFAAHRLQPEWRDPTPEENVKMQQLQEQIDAVDTALEASSVDDDPRWSDRDDLEAAYETIRQAARTWNPDLMQLAGVLISVDHAGALAATEGMIRKEDQKRIEAVRIRNSNTPANSDEKPSDSPPSGSSLPKTLSKEVTTARTRAIRAGIASDPTIALAVCVASFASRLIEHTGLSGITIGGNDTFGCSDMEAASLEKFKDAAAQRHNGILPWCLDQEGDKLLQILAGLVAQYVDLVHENATGFDQERQATADLLAASLSLDMTAHWTADIDFWMRLSKAKLLEEYEASPSMQKLGDRSRAEKLNAAVKMKKSVLAECVEAAWRGHGYLPELLITPLPRGALAVCQQTIAAAE
jgi:ParB family chromosome partitioning protein